ncbi:NRDE family protein [Alteromonas flava]|uniref:NRDE family protein n=1 Tax=Alteromonas flava TaxID=2048003 RepID=UPI000C290AE6|nr:NRDE family protein [Alteromonas flava]
MCILFIAVNQHAKYPLIIAANRDEFHQRPTQHSQYWPNNPDLLAGIDLQGGGTWMGVTRHGKFAALTNIRDPHRNNPEARTRGELVANFLTCNTSIDNYLEDIKPDNHKYNGYNLLLADLPSLDLRTYNNYLCEEHRLTEGYYGLSNASLDVPWPKIQRGKHALQSYCETHADINTDALFAILADSTLADDAQLPQTGVPHIWEKRLSSIFITGDDYGTRASTLLFVSRAGTVKWLERSFSATGTVVDQQSFTFRLA